MSQKVPGLTYLPIYREPHALYCGRPHPLFKVPDDRLDRGAIEEASFAVRGYQHFDDLYRANHPRPSGTVMHMEAQVMMILSGNFIGFLPCHIGDDWVGRGLMRPLKPKTYNFASSHFVVTRSVDEQRALVQSFVREIKRQAASA
jgi:DNA-binding transcriptional LysR family regulator